MTRGPATHVDEDGRECTKCHEYKEWDEYRPMKTGINGHAPNCKECDRKRARAFYQANPELVRGRVRDWEARNPERKAAMTKRNNDKKKRLIELGRQVEREEG